MSKLVKNFLPDIEPNEMFVLEKPVAEVCKHCKQGTSYAYTNIYQPMIMLNGMAIPFGLASNTIEGAEKLIEEEKKRLERKKKS